MLRKFCHTIALPGTLSNATYTFAWKMPSACTLIHVSSTQSGTGASSSWTLGTSAAADGYFADGSFGASSTPTTFDKDDFDGALVDPSAEHINIAKDTIVKVTITGGASTQATNPCIVLTYAEG